MEVALDMEDPCRMREKVKERMDIKGVWQERIAVNFGHDHSHMTREEFWNECDVRNREMFMNDIVGTVKQITGGCFRAAWWTEARNIPLAV